MPGGFQIPVNRDDADNIPPVVGVEISSLGRAPGRASTALPGNLNHATINIGDVLTEGGDPILNDFTNQARSVPFGRDIGLHCLCGADHGLPFSSTDGSIKTILCPACTALAFPPGVGRVTKLQRAEQIPPLRETFNHAGRTSRDRQQ